jgi:hypothetical protein
MKVPLRTADYNAVLKTALVKSVGLSPEDAERLISARWPLIGPREVLDELHGRGWKAIEDDLRDFLRFAFPEETWDEDDLDIGCWSPKLIDLFLDWAEATGHGHLTPMGEIMAAAPAVPTAFVMAARAGSN